MFVCFVCLYNLEANPSFNDINGKVPIFSTPGILISFILFNFYSNFQCTLLSITWLRLLELDASSHFVLRTYYSYYYSLICDNLISITQRVIRASLTLIFIQLYTRSQICTSCHVMLK